MLRKENQRRLTGSISWAELLRQLDQMRRHIKENVGEGLAGHTHILNLALNEAEAIAWRRPYPHPLFPDGPHVKRWSRNCLRMLCRSVEALDVRRNLWRHSVLKGIEL